MSSRHVHQLRGLPMREQEVPVLMVQLCARRGSAEREREEEEAMQARKAPTAEGQVLRCSEREGVGGGGSHFGALKAAALIDAVCGG